MSKRNDFNRPARNPPKPHATWEDCADLVSTTAEKEDEDAFSDDPIVEAG